MLAIWASLPASASEADKRKMTNDQALGDWL
jgi:hypothetical protein